MGIATRRPPYAAEEIGWIAGAHAVRHAWGNWFATPEAATVFMPAFLRLSGAEKLKLLKDGIIWVFEFGNCGERWPEPAFPTFSWLDAQTTLSFLRGLRDTLKITGPERRPDLAWLVQSSDDELARMVRDYDRKRSASIPEAQRKLEQLDRGALNPIAERLATPQTYGADEEGQGQKGRIILPQDW